MSFKFNPLTGQLDLVGDATTGASISFTSDDKTVDAPFLVSKILTLSGTPITNSALVFLNGLLLGKDCYSITLNEITFDPTLPFKVGHYIDVRYAV